MKKSIAVLMALMSVATSPVAAQDPVTFKSSDLPLILIDTHGSSIFDTPKITADMSVVDNGPGVRNDTADVPNGYVGKIGIEIRGSSSQFFFPKKQYSVELRNDDGTDRSASLLGLPEEEDWVLFAPYNDKTLMRDVLAYKLGRDLGDYAPRTKYCELVIKNQVLLSGAVKPGYNYQGVYVLIEKIKRDKNRVNINKLTADENSGDALTGGYILKLDKTTGNSGPGWFSSVLPTSAGNNQQIYFQYEYPKWDEITAAQQTYIQNFIHKFETTLNGAFFTDPANGYAKYIDVNSFMDFFIIQEVTRNVDGYRLSSYFYKQRDSDGGKLVMGPIWDFNLGFGNADYCLGGTMSGWAYEFNTVCGYDGALVPFWWGQLLNDPTYRHKLGNRWAELRRGKLSNDALFADIDSLYNVLNPEAASRNFQAWPVLGTYVWPNAFVGNTFNEEVSFLKTWITNRMAWLDLNMPGEVTADEHEVEKADVFFYPNPVQDVVSVEYGLRKPGDVRITLHDAMGRQVSSTSYHHDAPGRYTQRWSVTQLSSGFHYATVTIDGKEVVYKLVKSL